jgi:aspartyl-tRNA(Asn)/glutamyl-tRNA(Gln) amidotransferase subunit A
MKAAWPTAAGIARQVSAGKVSAQEILETHWKIIAEREPSLRAHVRLLEEESLAMARAVDEKRRRGEKLGRLAGVPVSVKDNILMRGVPATCASRILEGHVAAYDAAVVERLRAEDAVIVGKANLDEFAMGSSTENSCHYPSRNPWDPDRVPGGSSGGSAVAVASGMAAMALGSDTGGSVRQPAAFCGVVGLKPTYGRVSRWGLVAFASSLDQVGPLTRTVEDAALALGVLAGLDPRDATSSREPVSDYSAALAAGVKGLRVGLPKEYFAAGLDPEVEAAVRAAVDVLRGLGAQPREISLPSTRHAISAYYIIAPCEASSNLARFDGVRYGRRSRSASNLDEVYEFSRGEGFGPEVKRRLMMGTFALSAGYYEAYYARAQKARALIRRDFQQAFRDVDVIAAPTAPSAAFRIGEKTADPVAMYLSDVYTVPSSMAGNCALSVPCGLTSRGLPIGLQFMADAFREERLLAAAAAFEAARPFPSLADGIHA